MFKMIATILVSSALICKEYLTKTEISFLSYHHNDKGKRIATGGMPRTRKTATNSNTPSTGKVIVTSSNQNKIPNNLNGNDQQRSHGEMEILLKKRNEIMPCMTGLDRVANWKSSNEYALVDFHKKVRT